MLQEKADGTPGVSEDLVYDSLQVWPSKNCLKMEHTKEEVKTLNWHLPSSQGVKRDVMKMHNFREELPV